MLNKIIAYFINKRFQELKKQIDPNKENLFISVSGGETSWMMAYIIKQKWGHLYNFLFGFANTGREMNQTLKFNRKCSKLFGIKLFWVETVVHYGERKGSTHKFVNYFIASRHGKPFENIIKKYGIPNVKFLHCTREMKANPLKSLADDFFGKGNYYKAIGIRQDEFDRVSADRIKKKYLYPFVSDFPMTKKKVNFFWSQQPFRLTIKGYEGNCDYCFKKTKRKLLTIAKEENWFRRLFRVEKWRWWLKMELKYQNVRPDKKKAKENYICFNRKNTPVLNLIEQSKKQFEKAIDDRLNFEPINIIDPEMDLSDGCEESCEPFN